MAEPEPRIAAGDRGFEERIQRLADRVHSRFRYHSIELPDGSVLPGLQPVEHLRWRLGLFGLPPDLRGKRVLDIGAWDGWFSFECERRGADVVAVDCIVFDTFNEAKELIGSKVEYLTLDVNELSSRRLGRFDIVLFLGVLYHLRHPLLGLEKVVALTTDMALIESFVIQPEARQIPAVMEFYERTELGGQVDNWWGPSPECLVGMCRTAGFAQVELKDITNQRASIVCKRRWAEPDLVPFTVAPQLVAVVNNRTHISSFHPLKDEYLCCYFKSAEPGLTTDSLFVEVDGYGTQALVVAGDGATEDGMMGYQVNCLRPPGLRAGPPRSAHPDHAQRPKQSCGIHHARRIRPGRPHCQRTVTVGAAGFVPRGIQSIGRPPFRSQSRGLAGLLLSLSGAIGDPEGRHDRSGRKYCAGPYDRRSRR